MNDLLPAVIANLKAHKTWQEVSDWISVVGPKTRDFAGTVIFCPSTPFLAVAFGKVKSEQWKLQIGAQDVSRFGEGAYTGEAAASQIADICQYVLIGHSERRKYFREDDDILWQKVKNAAASHIEPIFCVQDENTKIPQEVKIAAYEPTFAIGTQEADSPANAKKVAREIKKKGDLTVLYGGSVSGDNVSQFLSEGLIDGVLVGATNSLDPQKFVRILESI